MATSYSVVSYDYKEIIEDAIQKQSKGKVFYFDDNDVIESCEGLVKKMEEIPGRGLIITVTPDIQIRADRIITLFGKPGAAFDEYDSYANQCLACTGGYDL